jgi:hypothetical protein
MLSQQSARQAANGQLANVDTWRLNGTEFLLYQIADYGTPE